VKSGPEEARVHEFAIATGVVDVALADCDGRRVTLVNLRIGALRQVVPGTLATAFELAARGTACEGARLEQELVPALLCYPVCVREWTLTEPDFRCSACEGAAVVIGGRELEIESIEVEDPAV
jgi:hydrogenase nickel incorporation protein HypA/HybF